MTIAVFGVCVSMCPVNSIVQKGLSLSDWLLVLSLLFFTNEMCSKLCHYGETVVLLMASVHQMLLQMDAVSKDS